MANEKHLLLEIGGGYTSGAGLENEIWACTLRFAAVYGSVDAVGTFPNDWNPVAASVNRTETSWTIAGNWKLDAGAGYYFTPDDWLNDVVAPTAVTWLSTVIAASTVTLETLKLYPIGAPTGKSIPAPPYTQGSPMLLTFTGTLPHGGGTSYAFPPQNSVVASHRTNQTGRRGRGRMFLPPMAADGTTAGGRLTPTRQAAILAAQVAMLEAMIFSGSGLDLWNVRPVITGKPFVNYGVIAQAQVGDVIDTQQRRRDRLTETRLTTPVTF